MTVSCFQGAVFLCPNLDAMGDGRFLVYWIFCVWGDLW